MNFEGEQNFIFKKQETEIKQEKQIPELVIHEASPSLEGEAENVLKKQWEKFWQLRFAKNENETSVEIAQNGVLLKDGALLHNLRYDEAVLLKILQSGILSGELGYGEKETRAEDAETHYCADFFVNQGDKSVQSYIEYAYGNEENIGNFKKKRIESFNCPREQNDSIAIVIDSNKPELSDLLQYSATGINVGHLKNFPVRFPYGVDRPEIAKRHMAVLVGIPSNFISSLVVGGKIASDKEKLTKLKHLIASSDLNIPILNYKGEEI